MNKPIDDYMSPAEAAFRWGLSINTVRANLKWNRRPELKYEIEQGLLKSFTPPNGANATWIISVKAMEKWYGKEPKKD